MKDANGGRSDSSGGLEWLELDARAGLSQGPPRDWLPRVRSAAYSGRFVGLSRRPPILMYLGENADYVIVGGYYCSCEGFQRRITQGVKGCTHVYAARVALEENRVRWLELEPWMVARAVWEAITGGRSKTVRRKLYVG